MTAINADLAVVGGGGSGLAAALQAAQAGLEHIVVVEKRHILGGTSALAGGLFACESPVQAREKIVADKDFLFRQAMIWAHYENVDPAILRAFIDKSGDTIRWLESMGLEFKLIRLYPDQNPPVQHNPAGNGARLIQVLAENCRNAGVQIRLKSSAAKIIRNRRGWITGLELDEEKSPVRIDCPAVIIATGGFAGNQRLLKKMCRAYFDEMPVSGVPLQGEGLALASDAGAAIADFATMIKEGPRLDRYRWPLMTFERDPHTIWVNRQGRRFVDETAGYRVFESVNAMLRQPDRVSYALFDSTICRMFEERMPDFKQAFGAQAERSRARTADSWPAIAEWIGAETAVLEQTIAQYNADCSRGYDSQLSKQQRYMRPLAQPPYYAIKGHTVLLDTIGGIRINARMEVMDVAGRVIPGLYACGVTTSGWESETYCSILSASAFGFAINSGRMAGENAARTLTQIKNL